jgi:thymidine kinase
MLQPSAMVSPPSIGRGKVVLILGCMFSGKTTELLRRVASVPSSTVAVFKHRIDTRYVRQCVVAHNRRSCPAVPVFSPEEITQRITQTIRLVAIDEAHFFDHGLVEVVKSIRDRGIDVTLTALDRDSWGRPFPVVDRLRAIASVRELATLCARCGGIADRTQRLTRIVDRTMVGGPESYEPRCTPCWAPPPEPPI